MYQSLNHAHSRHSRHLLARGRDQASSGWPAVTAAAIPNPPCVCLGHYPIQVKWKRIFVRTLVWNLVDLFPALSVKTMKSLPGRPGTRETSGAASLGFGWTWPLGPGGFRPSFGFVYFSALWAGRGATEGQRTKTVRLRLRFGCSFRKTSPSKRQNSAWPESACHPPDPNFPRCRSLLPDSAVRAR